jgi:hypothetical protein
MWLSPNTTDPGVHLKTDYENFILRRETTNSTHFCLRSFQLTLDSRPLFLRALYAKGKPIAGIFKPEFTKNSDATIGVQQGKAIGD